jgi:hypothetical protein
VNTTHVNATTPPDVGDQVPPPMAILEMLNGMWIARAVQVAARLGIADELGAGPRTVADLAGRTGTDADALRRLLHALSTVGVFQHADGDAFGQSRLSAALASDHQMSVGSAARLFGTTWQWNTWSELESAIRRGAPAFDLVHGVDLVTYLDEVDPEAGALFDRAMVGMSQLLNRAVLAAYDFSGGGHVADVSGAHSTLLLDLLAAQPGLTGVELDRPVAAEKFRVAAAGSGLGDRVRVVACDYRDGLPETADTILLNRVLHDWDDDTAARILHNCRTSLRPGGRIVIIEQLLTDDKRAAFLDLQMLVLRGGRERSEQDLRVVLGQGGLHLTRTIPTFSPMCVLVAHPADS